MDAFPLEPSQIAEIIGLVDDGTVSHSAASKSLFQNLINSPEKDLRSLIGELNLIQESDMGSIKVFVDQALKKYPEKVEEYRTGKKGLLGLFMGEVMKLSGGKADPKIASKLVKEALDAQ
jgi:aspartyl-tRNA(Asn)/glutamyl-tRNA(Gln) amidotransferase subunit B